MKKGSNIVRHANRQVIARHLRRMRKNGESLADQIAFSKESKFITRPTPNL